MTSDIIRNAVVESIAELVGAQAQNVRNTDDLAEDLGVDSMHAVNLLMAVEDRLGVTLPEGSEASLVGVRTVGDLVERLAVALAHAPSTSLLRDTSSR